MIIQTLLVLTAAFAGEITVPSTSLTGTVAPGDFLTVVQPCEIKNAPLEKAKIEPMLVNMPSAMGSLTRFRLLWQNEVYEITVLGNPPTEELRRRKFQTPKDADFCVLRRRFQLQAAPPLLPVNHR